MLLLQLFEQGLHTYTWRTEESQDFIETANALVCVDLHRNLDIVQTNCQEIAIVTTSWSHGTLDVFQARDNDVSYTIEQLIQEQTSVYWISYVHVCIICLYDVMHS